MEKYRIIGGNRLSGAVDISGAKNAAVAILPAVILCDEPCILENVPHISDVFTTLDILRELGARVEWKDTNIVEIDPRPVHTASVNEELGRKMRASYYFIGALLGKMGQARVPMPGGCNFGTRPIDLHLKGFHALGAQTALLEENVITARADCLQGDAVYLDTVSVGATMNIILAATRARGSTIIENAAREPHIVDLANFLNMMGADIRGAGTDVIKIRGVQSLHGADYSIIPDQIEAGTYMAMTVATGGDVLIRNVTPKHLESISAKLEELGAYFEDMNDAVRIRCDGRLHHSNIKTMPYPGFPTDMQPQFGVLLSIADGTSTITEGIWENRFRYTEQLQRMGAQVTVDGKRAVFTGVPELVAAPVEALDLRAGAAMVVAGLVAKGETVVSNINYIERGYETIVEKLTRLGGDIRRVNENK